MKKNAVFNINNNTAVFMLFTRPNINPVATFLSSLNTEYMKRHKYADLWPNYSLTVHVFQMYPTHVKYSIGFFHRNKSCITGKKCVGCNVASFGLQSYTGSSLGATITTSSRRFMFRHRFWFFWPLQGPNQ